MLDFESGDAVNHAVYGYLFLRHASGIGELSEAVLFHHAEMSDVAYCRFPEYAKLIHIADRFDVLLASGKADAASDYIGVLEKRFDAELAGMLSRADTGGAVSSALRSGEYKRDIDLALARLDFSQDEIMEFLQMLVYAIDFRSPYTVTHTANSVAISDELGRLIGVSDREADELHLGAFLHDIGKIAIPYDILEKPGKLTDSEMKIMRTHVSVTREIIHGFVEDSICDIASRHHEKLDGSGYPLGLTGESLTLTERIVAVADIVSALLNKRSYKEAFPKELVIKIITEMRDEGKLCPRVCGVFLDNYTDIMANIVSEVSRASALYEEISAEYVSLRKKYSDYLLFYSLPALKPIQDRKQTED